MSIPPPTERQARVIWASVTGVAIAMLVSLVAGGIWGLGQVVRALGPVLWPIAAAGVIAYLLDPVVDAIERRNVPRARAILCVFALAVLIILGLASSIMP